MDMDTVRSFVAIELPDELKRELDEVIGQLKSAGGQTGVKWVDPRSIHLTLKFLGDVDADRLDEITVALAEAARRIPRFRLAVAGLGVFPNPGRVRVAWVGVSGETDVLERLQRRVESALARLGFSAESRRFTPHLTLARVRERASPQERQKLGQLAGSTSFESRHGISVDAVHLMRSQLTGQGAIYSRISSVTLEANDESSEYR
jgi:2'-5' RNA ligase